MDYELEITFKKTKKATKKIINHKENRKKINLGIFIGGRSDSAQVKYFLRV
jgi:hypothetical protein